VMPKPNAVDFYDPALALVIMDLPARASEDASEAQRSTGVVAPVVGDPDSLFPFDFPLGTSQVVFYPRNPFDPEGTETINYIPDVLVWSSRNDDPTSAATPGVREILYMLVVGTEGTVALVRWDGVVETTILIKTGLDLNILPPLIGAQAYGPFIVASTDGVHGDYAGYLNDAGTWTTLAKGLVYDFQGVGGDPQPPPGEIQIAVDHWGAYKESYSGRGIIAFQGLMKYVYGAAWIDARGIFAFEMNPIGTAWDVPVATFLSPRHTALGNPSPDYITMVGQYLPVEVLGGNLVAGGHFQGEGDVTTVYKAPYDPPDPVGADYTDGSATRTNEWQTGRDYLGSTSDWRLWLRTIAGRLYAGGSYVDAGIGAVFDSVFDVTTVTSEEVFRKGHPGDLYATKGCLGTVPSAEIAEGFGASEEA